MPHLTEEQLNLYLDDALSEAERVAVEAHLGHCDECRAEATALQQLFAALSELAPAPAPDLVPDVLTGTRPRSRLADLGLPRIHPFGLIAVLQAIAALVLLARGKAQLVGYWRSIVDALPLGRLADAWVEASSWAITQWAMLHAWPSSTWSWFQEFVPRLSIFGDPYLSPTRLVILATALAAVWLVGNAVLLRCIPPNGQVTQM